MRRDTPLEGVVDEVRNGVIIATLYDSIGDKSYLAEIDLDRFADIDQPHCQPGALFTIKEPGPELRLRRKS